MGYFEYNTEHPDHTPYLYSEFPAHYVWDTKERKWQPRKQGTAIGRMYHYSPISGDVYYLRLLLTVFRQAKSFEELFRLREFVTTLPRWPVLYVD